MKLENIMHLLDHAQHEAEKKGEKEFTCPVCGGRAFWKRSTYNGHLRVACMDCGVWMQE